MSVPATSSDLGLFRIGFFFVDIPVSCWQLYLCNGEVRAAELVTSPSPLQVSSILPLSEVRLPGWSGSCSAGQAAEELQFSSR